MTLAMKTPERLRPGPDLRLQAFANMHLSLWNWSWLAATSLQPRQHPRALGKPRDA